MGGTGAALFGGTAPPFLLFQIGSRSLENGYNSPETVLNALQTCGI